MRRLFVTLLLLFLLFVSWPFIEKQLGKTDTLPSLENIKEDILALKEDPAVATALDTLYQSFYQLIMEVDDTVTALSQQQSETTPVEKPHLEKPAKQAFSVHNIELLDSKEKVEQLVGPPKRSSYNEYGTEWHTYHKDYQNFMMVIYDEENKVEGLYTNQDLIASVSGIKLGTPKDTVLQSLGTPLSGMRKGLVFLQFEKDRDYDVFDMDDSYVTVFYDKHENNTVTAIQIISKHLEQKKNDVYTEGSKQLEEGFAYQLFDLTNAARVNHRLPILTWDDEVKETAKKHSIDMAAHHYFSHTNLQGQSPFDRMDKDHIFYTAAGENLAYGQFNSIFAHEGLMNSLGHRENILRPEYRFLGVGVAFNEKFQPYYTENFFRR
ncbi:CAP domain-containing protein [Bacillus sp. B190/17]|uniref:CAP domain-containing protein n=1 Tax=Bacillus lumedeiriae TaxID=3058829 RepID=A0ABW8I7S9_9BACI